MVQRGLLKVTQGQETTQDTTMLGQHWFWRVQVSNTPQKNMQLMTISVSTQRTGPFREELHAFRLAS